VAQSGRREGTTISDQFYSAGEFLVLFALQKGHYIRIIIGSIPQ